MLKSKILTATLALTLALGTLTLASCGKNGTEDGKVSDTGSSSGMMTERPTEGKSDMATETDGTGSMSTENGSENATENESKTEGSSTENGTGEVGSNAGQTDSHARNRTIMPRMGK